MVSIDDNREEIEAAWAAEIQRRTADARANPHDEIDWRDALRDVEREVMGLGDSSSPSTDSKRD
jgi:hypothetical protein